MEHLPFWVGENRFSCFLPTFIVPNATFIGSVSIETIIKATIVRPITTFIGFTSIAIGSTKAFAAPTTTFVGTTKAFAGIYKVGIEPMKVGKMLVSPFFLPQTPISENYFENLIRIICEYQNESSIFVLQMSY